MNIGSRIRSTVIFFICLALYGAVIVNLYFIQIVQKDFFSNLANKQYRVEVTTYPQRGQIRDRHNRPVAVNRETVSAFVLPKQLEDKERLDSFLQEHFPIAGKRLNRYLKKNFMYIARRFPDDLCDKVQCDRVVDLKFMKEPSRFYPIEAMGQIVGVTDIDNKGQFGIEKIYEKDLAGEPTKFELEKDARSRHFYFKRQLQKEGVGGADVRLTIDSDLQHLAADELESAVDRLEAQAGAALIMNPANGEILAMSSYPNFNPNDTTSLDIAATKNFAIADVHELGSVMKTFVALAALSEDVVQPDEIINCENRLETRIDGMKFSTIQAHGKIPFAEVVARSNNIGMVKVAKRLEEKLYDHYTKLGFGKKTGLNFPGEQKGVVSHPAGWSKRSIISLSFGYELTASLLQLARAISVIANGGYLVTPKIILGQKTAEPEKIYEEDVINTVQDILRDTVQRGTGVRARIKGYDVMGKTGTAELIVNGTYSKTKHIYTFAGIVKKDDYVRVIVTCIKNTKNPRMYASNTAAPLFEKIVERMLIHDSVV